MVEIEIKEGEATPKQDPLEQFEEENRWKSAPNHNPLKQLEKARI